MLGGALGGTKEPEVPFVPEVLLVPEVPFVPEVPLVPEVPFVPEGGDDEGGGSDGEGGGGEGGGVYEETSTLERLRTALTSARRFSGIVLNAAASNAGEKVTPLLKFVNQAALISSWPGNDGGGGGGKGGGGEGGGGEGGGGALGGDGGLRTRGPQSVQSVP